MEMSDRIKALNILSAISKKGHFVEVYLLAAIKNDDWGENYADSF